MVQTGDRLGQLGLAVALDAGQGDDLARADRERDMVDDRQAPFVGDREVLQLEHRLRRAWPPPC